MKPRWPYAFRWLWHTLTRVPTLLAALWLRARGDLPSVTPAALVDTAQVIEPPILDDINLPPYHWLNEHDDFTPLMQLARAHHPRVVVELGTANGNLTANLCRQLDQAHIYTVNALAEEQTGYDQKYRFGRDEIGRVYRQHGYAARVTQIYANTLALDLGQYLSGPVVDLAIIDACHDTRYVINDFGKVLPYLSPRALVFFHDTDPNVSDNIRRSPMRGHLLTSYLACLILRRRGYDIRHLAGTWWAVWSRQPLPG